MIQNETGRGEWNAAIFSYAVSFHGLLLGECIKDQSSERVDFSGLEYVWFIFTLLCLGVLFGFLFYLGFLELIFEGFDFSG